MDPVEVNELFDKIVELSMAVRLEHGEIPMSFMFLMRDGTIVKVPTPPIPDNQMIALAIRKMAQVAGAEYVLQVCEAWMSRNECDGLPPSQQPDRVEVILVSLDGPDLKLLTMVEIRPDGTLGAPNRVGPFTGRMTGLSGAAPTNPDTFN